MAAHKDYDGDEPTMKIIHRSALNHIKDLLFPVLFLMVHGNDSSLFVAYIAMLVEGVQLAGFLVRKTTVPIYNLPYLNFAIRYDSMTVDGFTGLFVTSTVAIWLMIANLGYVAWGAHRKHHNAVWPIRTLRLFSSVLSTVLYITVLEVLVFAVVCKGTITDPLPSDLLVDISCISSARLPITIIGNATLIIFIPLCCSLTAVYFDINPILKAPMNKAHGRVDLIQCALRTALIIIWAGSSDDNYILRYGATFAVPSVIVIATWAYFPHYALKLNQMRAALHGGAGAAGAIAFLWALVYYKTGIVGSNAVIVIMFVAYLVSAVCVYIATGVIYRKIHSSVDRQMEKLLNGSLEATEVVFDNWTNVEIAARIATTNMDSRHRKIDPAKVEHVHKIFKHGIIEFPHEPFVRLFYAVYILQLESSSEEPFRLLSKVSDLNPAVDIQFQAYFIEENTNQNREVDFLGSGVRLDVAGFAEFQKLEGYAKVNHYKALRLYQEIWTLLYQESHRIYELNHIACVLYESIELADSAYTKLSTIFYAQFCLDLLKDTAKAEMLSTRADRFESRLETDMSLESLQMRGNITKECLSLSRSHKAAAGAGPPTETVREEYEAGSPETEKLQGNKGFRGTSGGSIMAVQTRPKDYIGTSEPTVHASGEADGPRRSRRRSSDADLESVSLFAAIASRRGSLTRGGLLPGPEFEKFKEVNPVPLETIKSFAVGSGEEQKLLHPGDHKRRPTDDHGRAGMRLEEKSSIGTSNADYKQAQVTRHLRARLLRSNARYLKLLITGCMVMRAVCLACSISNFVVSTNLLSSTSEGLNFLYWLHIREYSTALEYLRARQLQDAYQAGDRLKFRELQDSLQNQMFIYSDAIKKIYTNRPSDDGGLSENYYTVPQIPVNVSYYPQVLDSITVNYSLQQLTEKIKYSFHPYSKAFVTRGINIANMDFDLFSNITTNNDFRFIVDNAPNVQAEAFDYSMVRITAECIFDPVSSRPSNFRQNILYFNDQVRIDTLMTLVDYCSEANRPAAKKLCYASRHRKLIAPALKCNNLNLLFLCALDQIFQIFVSSFLVLLLDQAAQRYKRRQNVVLQVFRRIPYRTLSDQLQRFEENDIDELFGSELVSSTALLQRKGSSITRIEMRWQYLTYSVVFTSLTACFLYWNISGTIEKGKMNVIPAPNVFSDFGFVSVWGYAHFCVPQLNRWNYTEIKANPTVAPAPQLDFQTWLSRDYLYEWANHDVQYIAMTYGHVLYGDNTRYPSSVSYDKYSPALQQMLQAPCLPLNESVCELRIYEPSIGFTNNTVTLGIFVLTEFMLDIMLKTDAALTLGSFTPDVSDLAFIKTVLEPDYVDGYHRCELEVLAETQQFLSNSKLRNTAITIIEIVVCMVGFVMALTTMFTKLQFQDKCNVDLIVRLPNDILRDPAVAAVLKNLAGQQEGKHSYWPNIRPLASDDVEHQEKRSMFSHPWKPSRAQESAEASGVRDFDKSKAAMTESQYISKLARIRSKSTEGISSSGSPRQSLVQFKASERSQSSPWSDDRPSRITEPASILRPPILDRPELVPARISTLNRPIGPTKPATRASDAKKEVHQGFGWHGAKGAKLNPNWGTITPLHPPHNSCGDVFRDVKLLGRHCFFGLLISAS
ncbi:hypothetical protein BDK51DRAFT_29794 [Blyttiomyces helicus]|uniref:TmcB/TmcC TPR repeats domain-containing protein n=1 Tax=Blyttiomyces helicus TaxID=388810 RepID=A0A4P9WMP2_9FUNG|nr:hypothetical protein BDK51DRAFT_29794 [Blyttiomyces helicus]|eukprot:RKO94184.1 hypothetical protein BDK51DRAFT_29794 [Blyttiomyces helicus]